MTPEPAGPFDSGTDDGREGHLPLESVAGHRSR